MFTRKKNVWLLLFIIVLLVVPNCDAKKRRKTKRGYSMVLREKETNAIDFVRLVAMRLVYGVATRLGLGEQIGEALNGAFVPPGVDSEYGDYGLFDDDDDYDYR